jgi:hypothetical protein
MKEEQYQRAENAGYGAPGDAAYVASHTAGDVTPDYRVGRLRRFVNCTGKIRSPFHHDAKSLRIVNTAPKRRLWVLL